ncbi:MAG TPA: DNA internalization-related competence protein ComEC/Rec2 [Burkholderiales bacterium]|nr:DNA internalization-related competence protein ComEC/Rec2 [Burkholderiales bacterium]
MRVNIVLFALGVWLLQRQGELPPLTYASALSIVVPAAVLMCMRSRAARLAGTALAGACALGAGFMWAAAFAQVRIADALPIEWEARDIELIAVVAGLPQPTERSIRFELDVEHVLTAAAHVPSRISVSWWGRAGALPEVHAGERWRLAVRLKRPHGLANPHGFDYEAWLLERNIRATGYVRSRPAPQRLNAMVHRPAYWVEAARERLRARILQALDGKPYAGIIAALAIGDQRAIPADQWQTFTRTGVNHLMSISGLHVTMVSGLAYACVLWLWRRSARLVLRLPAPKAAALAGVGAAFLYTLLAGFAVPAQRTLYMVCVVAAALWTGRAASASVVLAAALLTVLVLDPWAVNAAGFWLSFAAVAAIFFVIINRVAQPGWVHAWCRTQAAVTIALLPLTLALFQLVSIISPVANAFAIPLVSLVVAPLALVGMLLPIDLMLHAAHLAMALCMALLEWMSALPDAVWQQHAPAVWTLPLALAGAAWLMLPRGMPARWLGAVACLPLFLVFPPQLRWGELRVTVLDVGHGLAVVVRTANHALLYDTGPAFGTLADSGNRVIAPYLRAQGVRRLDGMIVSHDDSDHTGGALSVLQAVPVDWVASSLDDTDPLHLVADDAFRCRAGLEWEWDGVRFAMLHPSLSSYDTKMKDNDRSCVLRIIAPGATVLLPADIERRAEDALLQSGVELRADVLVAPHQGSRTSSTQAFVDAVKASTVVFPVGYRNRFGHPHVEVVARYADTGAAVYRSDSDGAVTIDVTPDGAMRIERYRATRRRYWLDAPALDRAALDPQLDGTVR